MSAAHVEHVMGHVGAGDIVGNHFHANGAAGAGSFVDHLAGNECGGSGCISRK